MVKRYTLEEIHARVSKPLLSQMTTAEKATYLADVLAEQRKRLEQQSRMIAELRRRLNPDAPDEPKLGLKTWEEVKAYVDRKMCG